METCAGRLAAHPGSYAFFLQTQGREKIRIGRLGDLALTPGVCIYVGNALGPGGVAARCRHHARSAARPRWHIDYLRPECQVLGFWVAYGCERREHAWARALAALPEARLPLAGFGASDCRCPAHLVWLPERPGEEILRQSLVVGEWFGAVSG